ncbi:MAG: cytochrome c [Gemmatimonadota bacterium]
MAYLLSLTQPPLPGRRAAARDTAAGGRSTSNLGASVYRNRCASCHQADGQGVKGAFPPLAGDPVVTAENPTRHIEIILEGLQGKTIGGVSYATPMPAWGDRLTNAEVAAVVNHERTSWGNDAPTVTPEDVAEVREGGGGDGE